MNKKTLLISTTSAIFLIASATAFAQNSQISKNETSVGSGNNRVTIMNSSSSYSNRQQRSSSQQQTAINLSSANLRAPHILSVSTPANTRLVGQITINGVVVKNFNSHQTSVNLSPYLSKGTKTVQISGNYKPASSSVRIEFSSPGTKVSQQTGGNGMVRQTLIMTVR
jgi:hypothetical protein